MMKQAKNYFLTSQDIARTYQQWLASGDTPETRTISEEMGAQILSMCRHLTGHKNFVGYPQYMKDDMVSEGVLKIIKNLKNMNPSMSNAFFSYWTRCAWCGFINYLGRYYKDINYRRELMLKMLKDFQDDNNGTVVNQNEIHELEILIRRYSPDADDMKIE